MQDNSSALLDDRALAAILKVSLQTPRKWRLQGVGPIYLKIGRCVRYHPDDIAAFIDGARRTSTSDRGEAA